ncbi:MAG TPA: hypothetical protein VEH56_03195 [Candidatus Saccharimonadales bacterium]|nr:hypothetical protein [Candidatus Saccharimonadales bacterium]
MCNQCGKIIDLMNSHSFAVNEEGQLKAYYFCSDEHLAEYGRKKGMTSNKN